ncbi:MAG: deoxyribonuclease IV [Fimbriimonadales bacterium]|nr:deoxyribonuclease IV [Fimbriimonadales bacterium]
MAARYLGAHMPTGRGLDKALPAGAAIGCTAVQVFTSSPQQWKARELDEGLVARFRAAWSESGVGPVFSHDSYLVNLCAPDPEVREKSVLSLIGELTRCSRLGLAGAVSHIGAHLGQGEEEGRRLAAEGILRALAETPDDVGLWMETTAGQGSSLHWRFEHLADTLERCGGHPRLGICLDTAHVFAAGYDVASPGGLAGVLEEFDRVVGIERLRAVHCNDSKKALGSRVDRHEHLGQGLIGEECFRALVNHPKLEPIPIVVETPEAETMHERNVRYLWSLLEA